MLPRIHRTQANANHSQFCEGPGFIDWMTHESPPERPWLFCPESESPPLFFLSPEESPRKFHNKHREGSHLEMQALKKHKVLGKKNKFPWHLRASEQLKSLLWMCSEFAHPVYSCLFKCLFMVFIYVCVFKVSALPTAPAKIRTNETSAGSTGPDLRRLGAIAWFHHITGTSGLHNDTSWIFLESSWCCWCSFYIPRTLRTRGSQSTSAAPKYSKKRIRKRDSDITGEVCPVKTPTLLSSFKDMIIWYYMW